MDQAVDLLADRVTGPAVRSGGSGRVARFAVVGTPGDRRVTLFAAACEGRGLPPPRVIPWRDVLAAEDPAAGDYAPRIAADELLRIDSPGGDAECDALLRGPGDPTRVGGGARWYATLTAGLRRIGAAAHRAGAILLNDPDEIAVMFDKRRCHARLLAAEVPVPAAIAEAAPIDGYARLRELMAARGWTRVFVKPAHGSSASGIVALQVSGPRPGNRVKAVTSAAPAPGPGPGPDPHPGPGAGPGPRPGPVPGPRLVNSLRPRTYESEREVAALIDVLAPDGLHVERWIPKAGMAGRTLDLRVVVVAGVPTHAVVRTSRSPMTNLHLGGSRGDLAGVRAAMGEDGWRRALDACARAAACFPRSLMVGVDLLIEIGWRRVAVCEVNAFGDLLPGLTGLPGTGAEGLDTYGAQVAAVLSGAFGGIRPCAI